MNSLSLTLVVLGIIALILSIIAILYITSAARRKSIVMKKLDYLVEDVTYKSEMLNSSVETVAKISNYVDAFEIVAHKNIKSAAKVVARNKDDIYKVVNRLKKVVIGSEESMDAPKKTKPQPKKRVNKKVGK